ncbi:MAG: ester cyclase [Gemmatimonadota bacterium]
MSEENKSLVRRTYDAINRKDFDALAAVIADDVIEHDEFPGLEPSKAGVLQFFRNLQAAFSGVTMTVEDLIAEGDKVFARVTLSGTHQGEFLGIPATGRSISVPMADFFRIRDGQMVEHWGVADSGVMMQQLGVGEG